MMKLAFVRVENHPLILQYAMLYDHGAFTPTGLRAEHTDPVEQWCKEQNCGTFMRHTNPQYWCHIEFENEEKLAFFLLRWG